MATTTTTTSPDSSTDAAFRAWGSALATLITVGGMWGLTADTGQINWGTVTHPAVNVIAGFEIYKTADTLSSTFPLYMKVEYGTGGFGASTPGLWVTFGTGTNGAGTLTGNVSAQYRHNPALAGGGSFTSYASGGTAYWGMFLWGGANSKVSACIIIDRSRDNNGSPTTDYFTWILNFSSNADAQNFSQRTIRNPGIGTFATEVGTAQGAYTLSWQFGTGAFGTFAAPFPVFPFMGFPDNPITACMGMKNGDITELGTFDVVLYGISHHYLWSNQGWFRLGGSNQTNLGIGLRFE